MFLKKFTKVFEKTIGSTRIFIEKCIYELVNFIEYLNMTQQVIFKGGNILLDIFLKVYIWSEEMFKIC